MINISAHRNLVSSSFPRPSRNIASFLVASLSLACSLCGNAFANGEIDFVAGKAQIISASKDVRTASKGDRVVPGETIETGSDGEVHAIMDDNAFIAVRPNSRLKIEAIVANGDDKDQFILSLLKGRLRSISGWIGKIAPKNYAIQTKTATIGIRGTDHEVAVIEDGELAGTYDKVNTGQTILKTSEGEVHIKAGAAGFANAAKGKLPTLLATIPLFYKPTDNEKLIELNKTRLENLTDERLKQKRQDLEKKGGNNERGNPRITDSCTRDSAARNAFDDFIHAYELGNVALIENKLDSSMIGLQKFLDGIVQDSNRFKQMRITLRDTQLQCGPDVTVIQTLWEKRFLDAHTFSPGLFSGRTSILMHRDGKNWKLAAIAGDNPFSSQSGVLGQLTFGPSLSLTGASSSPTALPVAVEVLDPDLAGSGSLTVQIVTSGGDSEMVALSETTPGRFTRSNLIISGNAPVPGNNVLEVSAGATLTLRYVDQNPGNNRPPALLTRKLAITGNFAATPISTTPAPFSFVSQTGVTPSFTFPVTSTSTPPVTITGITVPVPISITGGTYSINGGPFTATAGTITNGQTVAVRVTNAITNLTTVTATITIGGVVRTFSATTF